MLSDAISWAPGAGIKRLEHPPGRVSDAQLKDVLGEVDTDDVPGVGCNREYRNLNIGDSIHVGLLRVAPMPHTT